MSQCSYFFCGMLGRLVMSEIKVQYASCTLRLWVRKRQVGSRS